MLGFAAEKSIKVGVDGDCFCMDTMLRLDSPGSSMSKGMKRKWSSIDIDQHMGSALCLRLGNSSSSSDSKGSSVATGCTTISSAKETDEESTMDLDLDFSLHLGNEKGLCQRKAHSFNVKSHGLPPKVDLELSLSTGPAESDITSIDFCSPHSLNVVEKPMSNDGVICTGDSTSLAWKTKSYPYPLHIGTGIFINQVPKENIPAYAIPVSSSIVTTSTNPVTCTSGITQQQSRSTSTRTCKFEGCEKGARGASGLCIAHGGGRRCQKDGCHKGAEGRTVFCKAHGGGRRCEYLGCTKSAEGRTDFCIAHGGGRRCSHEGCCRAARGKSGLCIRHGGGKRCQHENCTKSAEGLSGLCIAHGGGRRCQYPQCTKGAQGSTLFCKAHGGGKRCTYEGCNKGAEGSTPFCKGHGGGKRCSFQGGGICPKSVHGGTQFCVAHGGGKRCAVSDCTKSARGRTNFCVRHGGGKRCKAEGCNKSAQGCTDFCKGHGGGKRCSWGQLGSECGQGDEPCNSFARGKTGLCASHGALVQDKRVHGGATLGVMIHDPIPSEPKKMEGVSVEGMIVDTEGTDSGLTLNGPSGFKWGQLGLQPVCVPVSGLPSAAAVLPDGRVFGGLVSSSPVHVPEGRVHGGGLLAMLAGGSRPGLSGSSSSSFVSGPSEPRSYTTPRNWM